MDDHLKEYLITKYKQSLGFPAGFKLAADISTCHITKLDDELLEKGHPCAIGQYDYGYVVKSYFALEADDRAALLKHGFSQAFVDILKKLADNHIHYVFFDCDGYKIEGWQAFDW